MEQINKQTFQQKLKSYRKSPLSLTLFLLVTISALVTAFVLFFSNCIYPDKRCPAFDTGSVFLDIQF